MRPFGYHIAGGQILGSSLHTAVAAGFGATQIFLGPPQQMKIKKPPLNETELFKRVKRDSGIKVYVHAPYVLHAFAKPENRAKNNAFVRDAMEFAAELGCDGYVLHMGGTKWYSASDYDTVFLELLGKLTGVVEHCPLLLENCASGNDMSGDIATIAGLIQRRQTDAKHNLGLCLDTLHAWAWGVNYRDPEVFQHLMNHLRHLKVIHLNSGPAQAECGSKFDRHASLKDGIIPMQSFIDILRALPNVPCIAERDKYPDVLSDWTTVNYIDNLCEQCEKEPRMFPDKWCLTCLNTARMTEIVTKAKEKILGSEAGRE